VKTGIDLLDWICYNNPHVLIPLLEVNGANQDPIVVQIHLSVYLNVPIIYIIRSTYTITPL
jgi:hypothetical protein